MRENAATMPDTRISVQSGLPSRIIFVRQQFTPFGGGELILDRTISALLSRGVKISLLGRSWTSRSDIEFLACNPSRSPRFLRERRFANAACERLKAESDLIQSHERIACCDIFRAGDGSHAAFLEHRARGNRLASALLHLHPFHRNVIALEREMFTGKRLRAVIVNSQMVADEIMRFYSVPRDKIHLVPNGIDLNHFTTEARKIHREAKRKELATEKNRPVLLFVGSGYKRKGLDVAIKALSKSNSGAELWVVGSDKNPKWHEAQAAPLGLSGRIRMIGPVKDPLPYYAAADALILPTVYDPFPSTVIEAMACGLPVITSESCGARDAVRRFDPALVRDAYDVSGFADAICRALDHASKPVTIGAVRAIASEYGIDPMIDRMLGIYQKLAA